MPGAFIEGEAGEEKQARGKAVVRRLLQYACGKYGIDRCLGAVKDTRERPRIATEVVMRSGLLMCLIRLGSLNALEQTRENTFWKRWIAGVLPSADTVGRVCAVTDAGGIRATLHEVYTRRKRGKSLQPFSAGLCALVFDGHENVTSYLRCCPECCERMVQTREGQRKQYYHRLVCSVLVCGNARFLLDCEMQRKGEDEVAAAVRLFERVVQDYPRAFDLVVVDGLYLQSDFFNRALSHRKDAMAVLKDERRNLLEDAQALFGTTRPDSFREGPKEYQVWDIEDFTTWPQVQQPLRVVRSLETTTLHRQRRADDGKRIVEQQNSEWIWAITARHTRAPTRTVISFGHARWTIENEGGYNELVNTWHADHVYKHDLNAMLVFWLLAILAYNLFHAFIDRNLKPALRRKYTALTLAALVTAEFYSHNPYLRAPPT